jgi:hypothetical protein
MWKREEKERERERKKNIRSKKIKLYDSMTQLAQDHAGSLNSLGAPQVAEAF